MNWVMSSPLINSCMCVCLFNLFWVGWKEDWFGLWRRKIRTNGFDLWNCAKGRWSCSWVLFFLLLIDHISFPLIHELHCLFIFFLVSVIPKALLPREVQLFIHPWLDYYHHHHHLLLSIWTIHYTDQSLQLDFWGNFWRSENSCKYAWKEVSDG